ncbi:MAG: bifunctional UDP-N-acetylglucosamine diphosphorylase/glucosamine-1-phosphate N-acetyltransferase GlmU [Miltoncostaeaceae bacterium]
MSVGAVVLAAGQGTRMRSSRPKVLHPLAGRSMLGWVLAALGDLSLDRAVVVVGHGAEDVEATLPEGVVAAVQHEQRGTGDAAAIGLRALEGSCDTVLVLCGDTPLLTAEAIRGLLDAQRADGAAATVATAHLSDAGAYGRVVRNGDGHVERIVEASDATAEELALTEFNAGLYAADAAGLEAALAGVGSANAQGEVYLPDALPLLEGPVGALTLDDPTEVLGVNTRVELAACEAVLRARLREELMLDGVSMPDPERVYVDVDARVGVDTVLWPGVHLRGDTQVGDNCDIGPDVVITDSTVGSGTRIVAAHIDDSEIAEECEVGPYARLRPGCRMRRGSKAGTYVEMKKADVGEGAKVPHLSYVGDVDIGEGSNIGAGNITANYDGFQKHRTTIGARVKTGSDCVFVAPVTLGDDTMTGAGSIITDDVPDGALAIARARQKNIEGFTERAAAKARAAKEESQGGNTT